MKTYDIEILNWEKYQVRKDLKSMNFFRVQTDVFSGHKFLHTSRNGKLVFFYLLARCAREKSSHIQVSTKELTVYCQLRARDSQKAFESLEENQILTINGRHEKVPRVEKSRVEKSRVEKSRPQTPKAVPMKIGQVQEIVDLWNQICGHDCPQVRTLTDARKKSIKIKLKKYTPEDFKWLFTKVAKSDFLSGRGDGKWTCDFDWVLKGDKAVVIGEGKYDNRESTGKTGQVLKEVYDEWTK